MVISHSTASKEKVSSFSNTAIYFINDLVKNVFKDWIWNTEFLAGDMAYFKPYWYCQTFRARFSYRRTEDLGYLANQPVAKCFTIVSFWQWMQQAFLKYFPGVDTADTTWRVRRGKVIRRFVESRKGRSNLRNYIWINEGRRWGKKYLYISYDVFKSHTTVLYYKDFASFPFWNYLAKSIDKDKCDNDGGDHKITRGLSTSQNRKIISKRQTDFSECTVLVNLDGTPI